MHSNGKILCIECSEEIDELKVAVLVEATEKKWDNQYKPSAADNTHKSLFVLFDAFSTTSLKLHVPKYIEIMMNLRHGHAHHASPSRSPLTADKLDIRHGARATLLSNLGGIDEGTLFESSACLQLRNHLNKWRM